MKREVDIMINDVSLEIIQKCLNNCIHCSSNSCYESKAILELELIKEVIDEIVMMKAKRLCLSGGEPFLHPDIVDIVEYAAGKGLRVDIYSSGIIGEKDNEYSLTTDILRKCKMVGLSRIMFNLQAAHSEVYDIIMQTRNNYKKVLESIKRAQECGIETEIHFVPMKQNYNEVEDMIDIAKQLDVCQISFLKLVPHGRAKKYANEIVLNDEEMENIQNQIYRIKEKGEKVRIGLPLSHSNVQNCCHAVKEKIYIKFDGSVFGCEAFKYIYFYNEDAQVIVPDNIKNKKISDIIDTSEFLMKSKKLIEEYSCKEMGCENCPVQKYLKEIEGNV